MAVVKGNWGRLAREADGFEGVEYAAMTALIVGAIIAALISLGIAVTGSIGTVTNIVQL
jgi:Flp pilus assembly pilin Flp